MVRHEGVNWKYLAWSKVHVHVIENMIKKVPGVT
jgi:hypothetical protein